MLDTQVRRVDAMILSIDPSSTCTGWAKMRPDGSLIDAGIIRPKDDGLVERLLELRTDVRSLVGERDRPAVIAVVIEHPQTAGGCSGRVFAKQNPLSVASYGAAFGMVLAACLEQLPARPILTPTPLEWVKGGGVPSSKADVHKVRRVRWVEQLYRLERGALGPKTYAGNAADAILMGRWAAMRVPGPHGVTAQKEKP